ncbi:MAG: hypothetical protein CSA18_01065 [Deltaproteobacteria bacterium]|nr:MAG: hypothetical protein CSA18_01065 [Deltaproteobacteria bacterium]
MKFKVFYIPAIESESNVEEMNKLLGSVRVVNVHREFVSNGFNSFWSFAVEYLDTDKKTYQQKISENKRIDYKSVLSEVDFSLFLKLREWRKDKAEKEGIPVYTLFTNAQLAEIAEKKISSLTKLKKIEGVGDARIEKYGELVIQIVKNFQAVKKENKE